MKNVRIGFLHPGAMGTSLAATAQNSGHVACWASEGRSQETRQRAEAHGLADVQSIARLCEICAVLVSVCPPHAAEEVASQVLACSFRGLYLDANAIAPQRAKRIGRSMAAAGVTFVDGGIIGGPAWKPGTTVLYLSGPEAGQAAACFSAGPLETSVIGESVGKASALKMCYAAYSKGTAALLCAILAAAEELGVREELESQWSRHGSAFAAQARDRAREVPAKAWRFAGEMHEIAVTFEEAGVPGGFHAAAEEIYHRLAHFRQAGEVPPLTDILAALIRRA